MFLTMLLPILMLILLLWYISNGILGSFTAQVYPLLLRKNSSNDRAIELTKHKLPAQMLTKHLHLPMLMLMLMPEQNWYCASSILLSYSLPVLLLLIQRPCTPDSDKTAFPGSTNADADMSWKQVFWWQFPCQPLFLKNHPTTVLLMLTKQPSKVFLVNDLFGHNLFNICARFVQTVANWSNDGARVGDKTRPASENISRRRNIWVAAALMGKPNEWVELFCSPICITSQTVLDGVPTD